CAFFRELHRTRAVPRERHASVMGARSPRQIFLSIPIRRPWPTFSSPRDLLLTHRVNSPLPRPTGLSTAPNNARESHEKSISTYSQFMLNPQAVHDLASGLSTLYVAKFDGGAPKSSAVFLAPYPQPGYKEAA